MKEEKNEKGGKGKVFTFSRCETFHVPRSNNFQLKEEGKMFFFFEGYPRIKFHA